MPRIENLGPTVSEYCVSTGNGSSSWDVCIDCYEDNELEEGSDLVNDQLTPYNGDPDGEKRGGYLWHPPYEEVSYTCALCNRLLTEEDN